MPKYDPPYLKRPLVNAAGQMTPKPGNSSGAGPSGGAAGPSGNATSNHTSASMSTDALSLEAGAKGISFGNMPAYKYWCIWIVN